MSFREIMVCLDPHDLDGVQKASEFAARLSVSLSARLCGVVIEDQVPEPAVFRVNPSLIRQESEQQSAIQNAQRAFAQINETLHVTSETKIVSCVRADLPTAIARSGRLYDCSILPVAESAFASPVIEALIFESGRPFVILPARNLIAHPAQLAVIAWDGSRPATRAVHDAIPILQRTALTEIVTIVGEKHICDTFDGGSLARHLAYHDVSTRVTTIRYDGGNVGEQLMMITRQMGAGMLVMGAYGHSRLHEFVLGGATKSAIAAPLLPIFLSY